MPRAYQSLAGIAHMPYPGTSTTETRTTITATTTTITTTVKPKLTVTTLKSFLSQIEQDPEVTPVSDAEGLEPSSTVAECGEVTPTLDYNDGDLSAAARVERVFGGFQKGEQASKEAEADAADKEKGEGKNVDSASSEGAGSSSSMSTPTSTPENTSTYIHNEGSNNTVTQHDKTTTTTTSPIATTTTTKILTKSKPSSPENGNQEPEERAAEPGTGETTSGLTLPAR